MLTTREVAAADSHAHDKRTALRLGLLLVGVGLVVVVYQSGLDSFQQLGLQLLVTLAALGVGALLGFLFGIPRILQQPERAAELPPGTAGQEHAPGAPLRYQSNTNLEQISDWLTKILVGVGLTQLEEIGERIDTVARYVAGEGGPVGAAAAILVYFTTSGFLLGYLWTRLSYARLLVATERDIHGLLERKVERAEARATAAITAVTRGVGKRPDHERREDGREAALESTPPGLDVELPPITVQGDPNKNRFGGRSTRNGLSLTASVADLPDSDGWFLVTLEVAPTRSDRTLKDEVVFYLHPTFHEPVERVRPKHGRARLELISYGAFTVGVVADGGETLLELDLAELAEAPRAFREQ